MGIRVQRVNQWPAILALGDGFNWVDLTFIHVGVEWTKFAGHHFTADFIFMGLGACITYAESQGGENTDG